MCVSETHILCKVSKNSREQSTRRVGSRQGPGLALVWTIEQEAKAPHACQSSYVQGGCWRTCRTLLELDKALHNIIKPGSNKQRQQAQQCLA